MPCTTGKVFYDPGKNCNIELVVAEICDDGTFKQRNENGKATQADYVFVRILGLQESISQKVKKRMLADRGSLRSSCEQYSVEDVMHYLQPRRATKEEVFVDKVVEKVPKERAVYDKIRSNKRGPPKERV